LRRYGVAEIRITACYYRCLCHRLIAAHQNPFIHFFAPFAHLLFCTPVDSSRKTLIAASGQTMAQAEQPMHSPLIVSTGKNPFLLERLEIAMDFFGQTTMHNPQPLHRSKSI
jgi:hypothetical protein